MFKNKITNMTSLKEAFMSQAEEVVRVQEELKQGACERRKTQEEIIKKANLFIDSENTKITDAEEEIKQAGVFMKNIANIFNSED